MIRDLKTVADDLRNNDLTLERCNWLLSMLDQTAVKQPSNELCFYTLVYISRLIRNGIHQFSFDWYRSHFDPPASYLRDDDHWQFVYWEKEGRACFVDILNGYFDSFASQCECTDLEFVKRAFIPWDNPIEWP